ncbi:lipase family protein [Streptomyces gamaensis]|uniref:Lipase family protein n=1 Tax=Streptomyces gamaensis TaxID=1763542 RepID=A0ABW0ZCA0_9ACTN
MPAPTAFDHQATGYSLTLAYWMARASDLAYKDEAAIDIQAKQWGFDRVRHHRTGFTPPFPLEDTQAFTVASDGLVLTAFRGTEPREIRDWLSDADATRVPGPDGTGFVHHGFAKALDSVYGTVRDAIAEFRTAGQSVLFTGHSLGGALAVLAGARLYLEEPNLRADGVYTFGQPRTCDQRLAEAYNQGFADRTYRFVNNNDIVPHLPPEPEFAHVDSPRYLDSRGRLHESMSLWSRLADHLRGLRADAFDEIHDHPIRTYIAALETNFG